MVYRLIKTPLTKEDLKRIKGIRLVANMEERLGRVLYEEFYFTNGKLVGGKTYEKIRYDNGQLSNPKNVREFDNWNLSMYANNTKQFLEEVNYYVAYHPLSKTGEPQGAYAEYYSLNAHKTTARKSPARKPATRRRA